MTRYLVIANLTLGGEELLRVVRARMARGDASFHVLVPGTAPRELVWAGAYDAFLAAEGFVPPVTVAHEDAVDDEDAEDDDGLAVARERLSTALARLRALGAVAVGEVGDPDPVVAVCEALKKEHFDEVILSTLPAGISRWIAMDLPSRVARKVDVPVTHVEAHEPADVEPV